MNPGDTLSWASHFAGTLQPLNEGRGMNPGDTIRFLIMRRPHSTLNEGRGMNPGDTARQSRELPDHQRSTKAGA